MRVLVTGGTGFVGAHTVKAIADAGHEVRLLVRDPARIETTVAPLGVASVEHVVGDMTDAGAVRAAVDGCDAVVHAAAVVSLDKRRAAEVLEANPRGAAVVLDAAVDANLDPIVVVSSASALFEPGVSLVHSDLPPANVESAYGRSKAEAERIARRYQEDGAPVVITYPGGVIGPAVGGTVGETGAAIAAHLKAGSLVVPRAAISLVDVRDVAAIHTAVLEAGRGPRRYLCCGRRLLMTELALVYREITGRRMPVLPVPGAVMRGAGRAVDVLSRRLPIDTVITGEAMEMFTRWPPTEERAVADDLGVVYRPVAETLADTIRALHAAGAITARQAGRLALSERRSDPPSRRTAP